MFETFFGIYMFSKASQLRNAFLLICCKESGNETFFNNSQFSKADSLILVMFFPNVTDSKALHSEKTFSFISVTPFPILTLFSELQLENEFLP